MDLPALPTGPLLLLTVGPAASGKSTVLGRLLAGGVVDDVVSTDAIRAELGLAPAECMRAYATARERVAAALAAGRTVAVDATNVRRSDRAMWQRVAAPTATPVVAVLVGQGLELSELLERDAGRDRHVPADVIADQLADARASTPEVLRAEGLHVCSVDELVDAVAPARVAARAG